MLCVVFIILKNSSDRTRLSLSYSRARSHPLGSLVNKSFIRYIICIWFINSWSVWIHIMENTQRDVIKHLVRSQQQFPSVLFQVSLSDWQMCGTAENHLPLPVEIWVLGHWGKHRKLTMCLSHYLMFNILITLNYTLKDLEIFIYTFLYSIFSLIVCLFCSSCRIKPAELQQV